MDYPAPDFLTPSSATMSSSSPRSRPPLPGGPRLRKPPSKASLIQTDSPSDSYWTHSPSPSATEPSSALLPIYEARAAPFVHSATSTADKSVQVPPPSARKVQVTPLPFPAPVSFDIPPVAFKGLPLEAARWTFSSDQLQQIVSRAIKQTAQESHLRLLSLETLDAEMPKQREQSESTRFSAQAQYKFLAHRRNMLVQSLHSHAHMQDDSDSESTKTLKTLVSQLSSLVGTLDEHAITILRSTTHEHQMSCLQEIHQSSALAVALRKLNASYKKRTEELRAARKRVEELEAELEEAWRCAEGIAEEADDDEETNFTTHSVFEAEAIENTMNSVAMAQVMGVIGTGHVTKAKLTTSPTQEKTLDDMTSKASKRLSKASIASTATSASRLARVRSARKRSVQVSKASLRLPKNVVDDIVTTPSDDELRRQRSRSRSRSRAGSRNQVPWAVDAEEMPPVPRLRVDSVQSAAKGASFLELDNGSRNTLAPGQRTSTIEVGDMLSGRVGARDFDEGDTFGIHNHPFSAPHVQSEFPPAYSSDQDSPIDNGMFDASPAYKRGRPLSHEDRGMASAPVPGPSRVFSMQGPSPADRRERDSIDSSIRESIPSPTPREDRRNGLLKRGASTPQLKKTITEYFRISRPKRHTWGNRSRDASGSSSLDLT